MNLKISLKGFIENNFSNRTSYSLDLTIHSFFQLPFGLHLPAVQRKDENRHFSRKKLNLIRSLDLLVIDEISMVRADLLDAIDDALRRFRSDSRPFGGVQLLMIGDLHQLPPVVKQEEWGTLSRYYSTPYFFGSLALQKTNPKTSECPAAGAGFFASARAQPTVGGQGF